MARLLCRNLIRAQADALPRLRRPSSTGLRQFSGQSGAAQVLQLDLGDEGDAASPSAAAAASIIDEVVQSILVQRSTPDWLPFVPGGSFWVPPRKSVTAVVGLAGRSEEWLAAGAAVAAAAAEAEAEAYPSNHGWPSLSYFVEGKFPQPMMTSRRAKTPSDDESS